MTHRGIPRWGKVRGEKVEVRLTITVRMCPARVLTAEPAGFRTAPVEVRLPYEEEVQDATHLQGSYGFIAL
jgi:hypothetical protein